MGFPKQILTAKHVFMNRLNHLFSDKRNDTGFRQVLSGENGVSSKDIPELIFFPNLSVTSVYDSISPRTMKKVKQYASTELFIPSTPQRPNVES